MRKEDLVAFAGRDWQAIDASKRRRWAESRIRQVDALRMGDELRRHASALRPDWPTPEDRRSDLAVHLRVSESLRRVKPPHGR